jgi:hypothetical protein
MTDRQNSKLNMFQDLLNTCRKNADLFAGMPAFANAVQQLEAAIAAIRQKIQQQSGTVAHGASMEKDATIDTLIQQTMEIANALYAYAFSNNKHELLSKTSINKSVLYRNSGNELLTLTRNISTEAAVYAVELQYYGIDAASQTTFNDTINAFESVITKPRETIDEHKTHTGGLKQLFAEADSIVYDLMDKLIVRFKVSAPEFYELYKNSRNIVNTAKRKSGKEPEVKTQ